MASPIFDNYNNFRKEYATYASGLDEAAVKQRFPLHHATNGKIVEARKKALEDLRGWTKPEGLMNKFKKGFHSFTNLFRKTKKEFAPVQGDKPYLFSDATGPEKEKLESKSKMFKTLAKVILIIGALLVGVGVLGPLALIPLFFVIPETFALGMIIGGTIAGVAGVASMVVNPILKNNYAVREHRAKTDKDFQQFINQFLQGPDKPDEIGINFKIKEEDITDQRLHKIYLDWKNSMDEALSDKEKEKLAKEIK